MTMVDLMLMVPDSTESTVDSRNYIKTMEKIQEQSKVKTMKKSASSHFKEKMAASRSLSRKNTINIEL